MSHSGPALPSHRMQTREDAGGWRYRGEGAYPLKADDVHPPKDVM